MSDFKKRLLNEKQELTEKTSKLKAFIDSKPYFEIEEDQRRLLIIQLNIMESYVQVLDMRYEKLKEV